MTVLFSEDPMPETKAAPPGPASQGAPPREISPTVNPKGEMLSESSPSRYIAKVSFATGKEILRPIDPDDLLVGAHRDKNPIDVTAQYLASRLIQWTGNEDAVKDGLRKVNLLGIKLAEALGSATGSKAVEKGAKNLIGVTDRNVFFKFREATHLSEKEVKARIEKLQRDASMLLRARGLTPRLHVLLTGATGFLGKELLAQAATDRRIERLVSVVRPEKIRDPKTKEVVRVLSPAQRGALLLKRLHI